MALKAPPETQALLLELQAFDTKLAQLDHRAKSLPELATLAGLTTQADALRLTLAEQQGLAENIQLELSRVESDVTVVEARIARDSERLQGSSSVKDVAALEQELTALRKRLDDLEEIELAVMERLEDQQGVVAATTSSLADVRAQIADIETTKDAALAAISAERSTAVEGRSADRVHSARGSPRPVRETARTLRHGSVPAARGRVAGIRGEACWKTSCKSFGRQRPTTFSSARPATRFWCALTSPVCDGSRELSR